MAGEAGACYTAYWLQSRCASRGTYQAPWALTLVVAILLLVIGLVSLVAIALG